MIKLLCRALAAGLACGMLAAVPATAVHAAAPAYQWNNVRIVAGGYVDGIVAHPGQSGLFYARTDIGGAYRYNANTATWVPLNDWTSPANSNWMGIETIAIDPNDTQKLYMVAGLYTQSWWGSNGAVLVSTDQGASFAAHPLSFRVGGNVDGRNAGEKLQVDPNLGSTLFYGTFNDASQPNTNGLWKSTDSGSTWNKVSGFPALSSDGSGVGVAFIAFYKPSGSKGSATKTIYAGVSTKTATSSLYKSTDGGASWTPVSGGPAAGMMPQRGLIGPDGNLYITYGNAAGPNGMTAGQVWKYSIGWDSWTNITPPDPYNYPSGFSGLAIDPARSGTLIVMTMDHWWPSDTMYRSTNAGATWTDVGAKAVRDSSVSPWITGGQAQAGFGNWGQAVIDPFDSTHAFYTFGGGIWASRDLTAADSGQATHWTVGSSGIEETAVLGLTSPTGGAPLVSAIGDVCGFVHTSLTTSPTTTFTNPVCSNGTGVDFAKNTPSKLVRVGTGGSVFGAVSSDGGSSWTPFANQAGSSQGGGTVAVSADGGTVVWAPGDVAPSRSTDNGNSWTSLSSMLPVGAQLLSDGYNANLFYAWNPSSGTFYTSSDKGVSWYASSTGLPTNGKASAVTGIQGDLWLATSSGLYRSTNSGWSWSRAASSTVSSAISVGFGKAAVGASYPAIYLAGTVSGTTGVFRSTDAGASWVRINDDQHQWGGYSLVVGDPRTFGTVYVVPASGRGILYGTSSN